VPKLTIRLPGEHLLWTYPSGERSAKAREFIDAGREWHAPDAAILKRIFDLLNGIDDRLKALETGRRPHQEDKDSFSPTIENFSIGDFMNL
jgi:hypothetical protein